MNISKKAVALVAAAAAVIAVSSTGAAVAGGLITTAQIKDGAVTSDKVKNGTLTLNDFKSSERALLAGEDGQRGPEGPRGPQGPQGPQGLPGTSPAANTIIVESPTVTIPADDTGSVVAVCPPGTKVTGGGYFSSIAIAAASAPVRKSQEGWGVVINNFGIPLPVEVNAYAVCI